MTIKILIADDQSLFREALKTLLSAYPGLDIVGDASNGEEALRMAFTLTPDVVLMDLRMPIMDGVEATRKIVKLGKNIKVIVLTTFDDDETVFEGLRAGAVGYLLKDVSADKLIEAIRAASKGEYFLLPSITAKVISEFSRISRPTVADPQKILPDPLSTREIEILRYVATGASNKEIADTLVISEGTVKNHLSSILSKLGVRDRMQAVLKAKGIWDHYNLIQLNSKNLIYKNHFTHYAPALGIALVIGGILLFIDQKIKTGWIPISLPVVVGLIIVAYGFFLKNNGWLIAGFVITGFQVPYF